VNFDSSNTNGEFYTITYTAKKFSSILNETDSTNFHLRVKNDKVYFTGKLFNFSSDSFEIDNLLIYDFALGVGDTLKIIDALSGINYKYKIDSIVNITYLDGISRKAFYHDNYLFFAKGLGSNLGLIPFKSFLLKSIPLTYQELISVCKNKNNPVFSENQIFSNWGIQFDCNEKTIIKLIDTIGNSISIDDIKIKIVKIFPNPASNSIQVNGIEKGPYKIYNSIGQLQQSGNFENSIQIESLKTGLYYILIEQNNFILRGSLLKE